MVDLTPGFNLHSYAGGGIPFVSIGNGSSGRSTGTGTDAGDTAANKQATNLILDQPQYHSQQQGATNPPSGTYSAGSSGSTSSTDLSPADLALYQNQVNDLNSLLGRTDTGLNQGLSQLNNSYQSNVNQQQNQENQALSDYGDQRTQTTQAKQGAYDTINQNANNGYNSLAQIIGRSAGTGSSAFQDLLPNVIGKDTSAKRSGANQTFATNMGNIDTAQKKTEGSFANILSDLANQRNQQEQNLRTGVEQQRQSLLQQQQTAAANLAAAKGGNALAAAQAIQPAIENSRNAVDSFFNQFQPTVTAQQAAIAAPDLSQYTVDRSNVNAANSGAADPTNPYSDILTTLIKKQDGSTV